MITLYLYSKCSTCQSAVKFLAERKIEYIRKEITQETPSIQELELMLYHQKGNLKKLFNVSGQLYRELQLSQVLTTLSQPEALALLNKHGMLIKRPFLLTEHFGLTGFNATEWIQNF